MHPLAQVTTLHIAAPVKVSTYTSPTKLSAPPIESTTAYLHPLLRPPPSDPPESPPSTWSWDCCKRRCASPPQAFSASLRCLACGHRSCLADAATYKAKLDARRRTCRSSFEYGYWQGRNEWRRDRIEYLTNPKAWDARTQGRFLKHSDIQSTKLRRATRSKDEKDRKHRRARKRMKRLERGDGDCWIDCDYPGQCQAEHYRAAMTTPTLEELEGEDVSAKTGRTEVEESETD